MRQLNGCSTPAPRSSAAKPWLAELAQKKKLTKKQNPKDFFSLQTQRLA